MIFNQRPQYRLLRISWGICLLLSVIVHLVLLAGSSLLPEDWKTSGLSAEPEKKKASVSVRMVRKVKKPDSKESLAAEDSRPSMIKTSKEQESATRPDTPQFSSNRNTRAEGGRHDPDGKAKMPPQDGIKRDHDEIVLFNQDRQDGDRNHERDGNKTVSRQSSANAPYQPMEPSSPPEGVPDTVDHSPNRKSSPREDVKTVAQSSQNQQASKENAMQFPNVVTIPHPGKLQEPDALKALAQDMAKGVEKPILNLPDLKRPLNNKPVQNQPLYDPMFNPENQPGFKTFERKTKVTGTFSFGRRPAFDVEASPLGNYQAIIYRAIGECWYRQCDLNRDLILEGTLRIRILLGPDGKVKSMRQTSRVGSSEVQKSFTFVAIKEAKIPAMPPEVRKEIVGDSLEMYFDFHF